MNQPLAYTLIRSRRRTVALQITSEGQLLVRCPFSTSKATADRFVADHQDWIVRHQKQLADQPPKPVFTYTPGEELYYRGRSLTLAQQENITKPLVEGDSFILPASTTNPEALTAAFFRQEAQALLPELTARWAQKMGLFPTKIGITAAKSRWGSCSGRNAVNFSYRLVFLPPELMEYVVVHELAHIKHHNHSAAFHALVAQYLPDQQERRAQLRAWGRILSL